MPEVQTVDPEVSRTKFAREIERHRAQEAYHRGRGCFLIDAVFPEAFVMFVSTRLPMPIVLGAVVVDFTNFDLQPPSVRFVDPHTRRHLLGKDLRWSMPRRAAMPPMPMQLMQGMVFNLQAPIQNMIQCHGPEELPFLCLPGVREYHDHPAHTGDAWLLHRGSGEGSLAFIVEQIWKYGVDPFDQFQVGLTVNGLDASPERIPA